MGKSGKIGTLTQFQYFCVKWISKLKLMQLMFTNFADTKFIISYKGDEIKSSEIRNSVSIFRLNHI